MGIGHLVAWFHWMMSCVGRVRAIPLCELSMRLFFSPHLLRCCSPQPMMITVKQRFRPATALEIVSHPATTCFTSCIVVRRVSWCAAQCCGWVFTTPLIKQHMHLMHLMHLWESKKQTQACPVRQHPPIASVLAATRRTRRCIPS